MSERNGPWDVAMSTSGTTGQARSYGFTLGQIEGISAIYRDLYALDPASRIVTAMPAAHNFAFVAGVCAAAGADAGLIFAHSHDAVVRWLKKEAGRRRVVVLASPVLLDQDGLDHIDCRNLLIDSGAAPLARPYLLQLQRRGVVIREGYGTTETLSLTHFDVDGSAESAGTVGYPVAGVSCRIDDDHRVWIRSPFSGLPLDSALNPQVSGRSEWMVTGDLGAVDTAGRLRIIGRIGDTTVGGLWPRDVLDGLGDLLGSRTASIHCAPNWIEVRTLTPLSGRERTGIADRVAAITGLPSGSIFITTERQRLTYSLKLPLSSNNPESLKLPREGSADV